MFFSLRSAKVFWTEIFLLSLKILISRVLSLLHPRFWQRGSYNTFVIYTYIFFSYTRTHFLYNFIHRTWTKINIFAYFSLSWWKRAGFKEIIKPWKTVFFQNSLKWIILRMLFFNCDSLHARLNSHYEAWSYKKKKHKKIKAYRKSI